MIAAGFGLLVLVGLVFLLISIWTAVLGGKRATERLTQAAELEQKRQYADRLRQAKIAIDLAAKSPGAVTPVQLADAQSIVAEDTAQRRARRFRILIIVVVAAAIIAFGERKPVKTLSESNASGIALETSSATPAVSVSPSLGITASPSPKVSASPLSSPANQLIEILWISQ